MGPGGSLPIYCENNRSKADNDNVDNVVFINLEGGNSERVSYILNKDKYSNCKLYHMNENVSSLVYGQWKFNEAHSYTIFVVPVILALIRN